MAGSVKTLLAGFQFVNLVHHGGVGAEYQPCALVFLLFGLCALWCRWQATSSGGGQMHHGQYSQREIFI
jgi:hypothetical protein